MSQQLSGKEFAQALQEGRLKMAIQKEGLVKQEGSSEDVVMFSENMACQNWISIPVEMIERAEYLRQARCRDHEHPFVRLFLHEPPSENTPARVLAELLRQAPNEGFNAEASKPNEGNAFLKICCDASVEVENRATGKRGSGEVSGFGAPSRCEDGALRLACKQAGVNPKKPSTYRIISRESNGELCNP